MTLGLVLLASLAFAGGKKEEGIRLLLTGWMMAEASGGEVWLPERIAEWEKLHPGVKVEIIRVPRKDTKDK